MTKRPIIHADADRTWRCNCATRTGERCKRMRRHRTSDYCPTHWTQLLRWEEERTLARILGKEG